MYWVKRPWRQLFDFSGRATRREYWLFVLQLYLLLFLVGFVGAIVIIAMSTETDTYEQLVPLSVLVLFVLGTIPFLSATVRRIHDHNKTGWLLLLWFIPAVGWIFFLIMMLAPGTDGENDYGPDPRQRGFTSEDAYAVFS